MIKKGWLVGAGLVLLLCEAYGSPLWQVKYKNHLKEGNTLSVETTMDGKLILTIEEHINTLPAPEVTSAYLTGDEAEKLAHILYELSKNMKEPKGEIR